MIAAWLLCAAAAVPADDLRVVIAVGANRGTGADRPLAYAERDASRFAELMEVSGAAEPSRIQRVLGAGAEDVRAALTLARGQLLELTRQGPTSLVFYASSHADAESLHLSGSSLSFAELRRLIAELPAEVRVAIVDGCRTRVATKGGTPGPPVELTFHQSAELRGDVLISAAGLGEAAQEWEFFEGSLFTHHLLAGLRGVADVDKDGRVSLAEAYSYTYRRTIFDSARSSAGAQHPSFSIAMEGFGEWTVLRPARLGAALVLGEELEGRFWVASSGALVAEVEKVKGERLELGVVPGTYRVVRSEGARVEALEVRLPFGGTAAVGASGFVRVSQVRATLRGEAPILARRWRAGVHAGAASPLVTGAPVEPQLGLFVSRDLGDVFVRVELAAARSAIEAPAGSARSVSLRGGLGAGVQLPLWIFWLRAGADLRLTYVRQDWSRPDEAQIARVFGLATPDRTAWLPSAHLFGGFILPLSDDFEAGVELGPAVTRVRFADGRTELPFSFEARATVELSW